VHLSALQRDHELRSQSEARQIRKEAAEEEARRREIAAREERERQLKARIEADVSYDFSYCSKLLGICDVV
jgi:nucleoporin GLE1